MGIYPPLYLEDFSFSISIWWALEKRGQPAPGNDYPLMAGSHPTTQEPGVSGLIIWELLSGDSFT